MKQYLLLILIMTSVSVKAQNSGGFDDYYKKITFGFAGGFNLTSLSVSSPNGNTSPLKTAAGFGFNADIRLNNYFSIRPGFEFLEIEGAAPSYVANPTLLNYSTTNYYDLTYLELPVHLFLHIPVGYNKSVLLGAGPFIGYGFKATYTRTEDYGAPTYNAYFGNKGDFSRINTGITTAIGFLVNGNSVSIDADFGLKNIALYNDGSYNGTTIKTFALYLGVGHSF